MGTGDDGSKGSIGLWEVPKVPDFVRGKARSTGPRTKKAQMKPEVPYSFSLGDYPHFTDLETRGEGGMRTWPHVLERNKTNPKEPRL